MGEEYDDNSGSARALKIDSDDNIYAIYGTKGAIVKIDSAGGEKWTNDSTNSNNAQMNDLQLVSDGIVIAGHRYGDASDIDPNGCRGDGCGGI